VVLSSVLHAYWNLIIANVIIKKNAVWYKTLFSLFS
jgi:hypothetical protein